MLNSEKMVASIQKQDLEHADKYFKRALKEDDAETLLELAEYLESIGFLPQAREIYLQERESYPEVNINLAQIATEDGDIEGLSCIWMPFHQKAKHIYQLCLSWLIFTIWKV